MKLEILHVPDCPNAAVLEQRLREAIAGETVTVEIAHRVIDNPEQAASVGMAGSPTLLVDGRDPFAGPGQAPSVSCRLYPGENGGLDGAPSVMALRTALRPHSAADPSCDDDAAEWCCTLPAADSATALSTWRAAAQPVDTAEKAAQQAVLRFFSGTGRAPTSSDLAETVTGHGVPIEKVLRRLHDADALRLDETGAITAAYPFSATPTPHQVRIDGGPTVSAMCAVDALGMGAMLGTQVTITTAEPVTADTITVTADSAHATPQPATTVVFIGARAGRGPSADTCCRYLNFFTDGHTAQDWINTHPGVDGSTVGLPEAHRLGITIFGNLLRT